MPYFFSGENLSQGRPVEVTGEEARHILLSHRIKTGEKVKLQGPDRNRFLCEVVTVGKKSLTVTPVEKIEPPKEPVVKFVLFQSVVSEKALDFIFQKGTELGLNKIVLFNSKNTATKLSSEAYKKKQGRWGKILKEAAKQSERAIWPSLEFLPDIDKILSAAQSFEKVFLADISGDELLVIDGTPPALGLIIGPEGGFTEEEIKTLKSLKNLQTVSLGPILLRADTAALALIARLSSCL